MTMPLGLPDLSDLQDFIPSRTWDITEQQVAELQQLPLEFWEQILGGGPDTVDWLYNYLSDFGYTTGLSPDDFSQVVQDVVQYGGLEALTEFGGPDRTVITAKAGSPGIPAKPVSQNLNADLTAVNEALSQQQPEEDADDEEEDEQEKEEDAPEAEEKGGIDGEQLLEILKQLLSQGLGPNATYSPLTQPIQRGAQQPLQTGPAFQTPRLGGTLGGRPRIQGAQSAGPSYSAPIASVDTPSPTQTMSADQWLNNIVDQLRELYPDLFGEDAPEDQLENLWQMNQQQYDLLLKWWNDPAYRAYWTGDAAPLNYYSAYDFLTSQGFIDPDQLSREEFASTVYPLLQTNGPQFLLDEGWIGIRERYAGEENTDPFPEGNIPENVPYLSMRSDAIQLLYNWLGSDAIIGDLDLSGLPPEVQEDLQQFADSTVRDYWLLDENGDSTYRVLATMGMIDPSQITPNVWARLWRDRLYPIFSEGPDAFYQAVQSGEFDDVLEIYEPGPDDEPFVDPFQLPEYEGSPATEAFYPERLKDGYLPWAMTNEGFNNLLSWMNTPVWNIPDGAGGTISGPEIFLNQEISGEDIYDWFRAMQDQTGPHAGYVDTYAQWVHGGGLRAEFANLWDNMLKPQLIAAVMDGDYSRMAATLYDLHRDGYIVLRPLYDVEFDSPLWTLSDDNDLELIPFDPVESATEKKIGEDVAAQKSTQKQADPDRVNKVLQIVDDVTAQADQDLQTIVDQAPSMPTDEGSESYMPGDEKKQQQPQTKAAPVSGEKSIPATPMPQGGTGKGQPDQQAMGQQANELAKGLAPQQPSSPLAGNVAQSTMGGGLGRVPTGRGVFTSQ